VHQDFSLFKQGNCLRALCKQSWQSWSQYRDFASPRAKTDGGGLPGVVKTSTATTVDKKAGNISKLFNNKIKLAICQNITE